MRGQLEIDGSVWSMVKALGMPLHYEGGFVGWLHAQIEVFLAA